jgi:hypothetical protein
MKLSSSASIQPNLNTLRFLLLCCSVCLASGLVASDACGEVVLSGVVKDDLTGEPLFPAILRVSGTHTATVTNPDGRFELAVRSVPVTLLCSHIGFRSVSILVAADFTGDIVFELTPVMYEMEELVVTAEDPAISIMRKVIERKQQAQRPTSLKANAYTRLTLRKDSTIVSVIESMSEAFWQEEDGWREVLKAKRTTRNLQEDLDTPAASFMKNLYEDDVEVVGHTLQGVTHPDALSTYDFSLVGRRKMDDRVVYDISVKSKSPRSSAFEGQIAVLDEAYALLDADLRPNASFIFTPPLRDFTIIFHQQFRAFGEDVWLPVDLRTTIYLDIGFLGLSFPPIQSEQVTRISDYEVNAVVPDTLFKGKKPFINDISSESAPGSLLSTAGVVIPLTVEERLAFEQIDSTETLEKVFKPKGALARFVEDDDDDRKKGGKRRRLQLDYEPQGWYNRVDGFHVGLKSEFRVRNRQTRFNGYAGYSTKLEGWALGGEVTRPWGSRRDVRTRVGYRRGTTPRQSDGVYSNFSASTALFGGQDYFDFYWQEQYFAEAQFRIRSIRTEVLTGLQVEQHRSVTKTTDFAIGSDFNQRENPAINDGDLRSLRFKATYGEDSGPAVLLGEKKVTLWVEHSRPGLMGSDFDFTQVKVRAGWRFTTFFNRRMMPNTLDITVVGGFSTGQLPVQRFGHIDASLEWWHTPGSFRTLHANPYEGEEFFGMFWEHHFRTLLFEYLGWDGLVTRNIGIIVFGGHGRTWISGGRLAALAYAPQYVDAFHHEIGASVNGILGLIRVDFAKRLDAPSYEIGVGIARIF